jgi:hypothetical protein
MHDVDPDPMRGLDFEAIMHRPANPILWEWCPYCPSEPRKAEAPVVSAVRRLRLGAGPYGQPDGDELAQRRRKKGAG